MARKKKETATTSTGLPADYLVFLESLKTRVRQSQTKAMLSVNRELIQLYWDIGRLIVERQEREGWGKGIVDRLAADIQKAFPGLKGFSSVNVWRMRAFYVAYRTTPSNLSQAATDLADAILSQAVTELPGKKSAQRVPKLDTRKGAQPERQLVEAGPPQEVAGLPWGHNVVLLFKLKERTQRLWYAAKTIEHGWSRAILTVQIESDLFARQGKAVTNFEGTLPEPQSELAQQSLKDPYLFDFLTLHDDAIENDLELGLVDHIQKFLMALGSGFSFVGRQFPLTVGEEDFNLDLLFYHLKLRCFVVIEPLCGRPHNNSSVVKLVMWRWTANRFFPWAISLGYTPHNHLDYSVRRNSIGLASSFHGSPSFSPATSQLASALAFISRSTSA